MIQETKEVLSEGGKVSSSRFVMILIAVVWMTVWAVTSFRSDPAALAPVSFEQLAIVLGSMGLKVAQKFGEKQA